MDCFLRQPEPIRGNHQLTRRPCTGDTATPNDPRLSRCPGPRIRRAGGARIRAQKCLLSESYSEAIRAFSEWRRTGIKRPPGYPLSSQATPQSSELRALRFPQLADEPPGETLPRAGGLLVLPAMKVPRYIYWVPDRRGHSRWNRYDFLALSQMTWGVSSPGSETLVDR